MTITRISLAGLFGLYLMLSSLPSWSAAASRRHPWMPRASSRAAMAPPAEEFSTRQSDTAGAPSGQSKTPLQTGQTASIQSSSYTGFTGPITFQCTISDDTGSVGTAAMTVMVVPPDVGPQITMVWTYPSLVPPSGLMQVYVTATDSFPVVEVIANGIPLQWWGGNTWGGQIAADPAYGQHIIAAVAVDINGESATDISNRYVTARTASVSGKALMDPIMATAAQNFLFTVFGKVSTTAQGTFVFDDGSGSPVMVVAPGAPLESGDYAEATGTIFAGTNPVLLYSSADQVLKLN